MALGRREAAVERMLRSHRDQAVAVGRRVRRVLGVDLQLVHALMVEQERTLGAEHLEPEMRLAAPMGAAGDQRAHDAVVELHQRVGGVFVLDRAILAAQRHLDVAPLGAVAGGRHRALGNHDARVGHQAAHRPDQVVRDADQVRGEIAERAEARHVAPAAPGIGRLGVGHVVFVAHAAEIADLADRAILDQLLGEPDGGRAHVVVADQRLALGAACDRGHLLGGVEIGGQRLLAIDMLAGLERGDGDLRMQRVGRGDRDHVDSRIGDQLLPRTHGALEAEALRGLLRGGEVHVRHHFETG